MLNISFDGWKENPLLRHMENLALPKQIHQSYELKSRNTKITSI